MEMACSLLGRLSDETTSRNEYGQVLNINSQDENIRNACNEYGMAMITTDKRMFLH